MGRLTFHYAPMTTASITRLVIEELGLDVDTVRVDLARGDPNGQIPLIVHDGVPIWEAAAITLYLGDVFGVERGLWPASGPARGAAMKWVAWTHVTLGEAVGRWLRHTTDAAPADQRNARAGQAAFDDLRALLGLLDHALSQAPWLVPGAGYTLADGHVNAYIDWGRYLRLDFSAWPHLEDWSARCAARPAYRRAMHGD